jgi:hypothetical protein
VPCSETRPPPSARPTITTSQLRHTITSRVTPTSRQRRRRFQLSSIFLDATKAPTETTTSTITITQPRRRHAGRHTISLENFDRRELSRRAAAPTIPIPKSKRNRFRLRDRQHRL